MLLSPFFQHQNQPTNPGQNRLPFTTSYHHHHQQQQQYQHQYQLISFWSFVWKMKATAPLRPNKDSTSMRPPHCATAAEQEEEEEDLLFLHHDMNDCYSRLRRLVPTIPPHKKVSRVEILQHVIDYILDLQLALEAQPALWRPVSTRTPLAVLNTEQMTTVVNKQEDSILCR